MLQLVLKQEKRPLLVLRLENRPLLALRQARPPEPQQEIPLEQ